jgi:hypothetical protein
LFSASRLSPDTFYAEMPLMNFDSFTELHDEYQLAHKDLVPSSILTAATIQKQCSSIPLMLFDPGSDLTFIHEKCIPHGAIPVVSSITIGTMLAGTFSTSRVVNLDKILLTEFHCSCRIVINTNCPYNIKRSTRKNEDGF